MVKSDLEVALSAANVAAAVIRAGSESIGTVRLKGAVDPVTDVDTEAEVTALAVIAEERPGDVTLGEETGGAGWEDGRVWILDPLDGTVNFAAGIPHVAVSVALWTDGQPQVGVIVDAFRRETFTAVAGEGASLDDREISVSKTSLGDAVVATGFPYDRRKKAGVYAADVGRVLGSVRGLRRFGAAALDFCWVACGRLDAYWEYGLAPWDVAAGVLIVEEAGGRVSDTADGRHTPDSPSVLATNGLTHPGLIELLDRRDRG